MAKNNNNIGSKTTTLGKKKASYSTPTGGNDVSGGAHPIDLTELTDAVSNATAANATDTQNISIEIQAETTKVTNDTTKSTVTSTTKGAISDVKRGSNGIQPLASSTSNNKGSDIVAVTGSGNKKTPGLSKGQKSTIETMVKSTPAFESKRGANNFGKDKDVIATPKLAAGKVSDDAKKDFIDLTTQRSKGSSPLPKRGVQGLQNAGKASSGGNGGTTKVANSSTGTGTQQISISISTNEPTAEEILQGRASILLDDQEDRDLFVALAKKGLNLTKPEIISINEFIPVISENHVKSSQIDLNVENDSILYGTGVSRLIELHRQIREYITDTAYSVMRQLYPAMYQENFIDVIDRIVTNRFEADLYAENVGDSVKNVINYMLSDNAISIVTPSYKEIIRNNISSPFLRGVIEYFILKKLLNYIPRYAGKIAALERKLENFWGIHEFTSIKEFNSENALRHDALKYSFRNNNRYSLDSMYQNITGVKQYSNHLDFDAYTNLLYHLKSLIYFVDSTAYLKNPFNPPQEHHHEECEYGQKGDMGAFTKSWMSQLKPGNYSYVRENLDNLSQNGFTNSATNFGEVNVLFYKGNSGNASSTYSGLYSNDNDKLSDQFEIFSELFSASVFDTTYKMTKRAVIDDPDLLNYGKNSFLLNLSPGQNILYDRSVIGKYFEEVLGVNIDCIWSKKDRVVKTLSSTDDVLNSIYLSGLFGKRTENNITYRPLESNNTMDSVSGPSYYMNETLNNDNTDSFKTFVNNYVKTSNNVIEDVLTLFPDHETINYLINNTTASDENYWPPVPDNLLSQKLSPIGKSTLEVGVRMLYSLADDFEYCIEEMNRNSKILFLLLSSHNTKEEINNMLNNSYLGALSALYDKVDRIGVLQYPGLGNNYSEIRSTFRDLNRRIIRKSLAHITGLNLNENLRNNYTIDELTFGEKVVHQPENYNRNLTSSAKFFEIDRTMIVDEFKGALCFYSRPSNNPSIMVSNVSTDFPNSFPEDGGTIELSAGFTKLFGRFMKSICSFDEESVNDDTSLLKYTFESNHYIAFFIARRFLLNCIKMTAEGTGDKLKIKFDGFEGLILGIRNGIRSIKGLPEDIVGVDTQGRQIITFSNIAGIPLSATSVENINVYAYVEARKMTIDMLSKITDRMSLIKDCLGMMAGHSNALSSIVTEIDYLNNSTNQGVLDMLKNTLKDPLYGGMLLKDIESFTNDQYPMQVFRDTKNYFTFNKKLLFPNDLFYDLNKFKLMYKVMSSSGYGFLENEKFGNKMIVNVGVTNSLIKYLRKKAYKETNNIDYLDSPYIAITIRKNDALNPSLNLYPKVFIYNTLLNVEDYNQFEDISSHLKNFNDNLSLNQLLDGIEMLKYVINDTGSIDIKTVFGSEINNKDILINHLFDYILKFYTKVTTELNLDESSFVLKETQIKQRSVISNLSDGNKIINEFEKIVGRLAQAYPQVFDNQELQSEAFRMVNVLKQMFPFSVSKRFDKISRPNCFDKTYSMFINEKDFIPQQENSFTYYEGNVQPIFEVTSKLMRPEPSRSGLNTQTPVIKDYLKRSNDSAVEMYQLYASIGILPKSLFEDNQINPPPPSPAAGLVSEGSVNNGYVGSFGNLGSI